LSASADRLRAFIGYPGSDERGARKAVIEFMSSDFKVGTYDANSLKDALVALQDHFGIDSATFYRHYRSGAADFGGQLDHRVQHIWADYYSEWLELTGATPEAIPREDEFAGQIRRELACSR
jgi:hypothetical protein